MEYSLYYNDLIKEKGLSDNWEVYEDLNKWYLYYNGELRINGYLNKYANNSIFAYIGRIEKGAYINRNPYKYGKIERTIK